ncbi:hypothetical protein ZWY2020_049898 [Hordeum vulgare]|nr:hypothetical protein ZWY2020_049898 [Hordeum vulgare]
MSVPCCDAYQATHCSRPLRLRSHRSSQWRQKRLGGIIALDAATMSHPRRGRLPDGSGAPGQVRGLLTTGQTERRSCQGGGAGRRRDPPEEGLRRQSDDQGGEENDNAESQELGDKSANHPTCSSKELEGGHEQCNEAVRNQNNEGASSLVNDESVDAKAADGSEHIKTSNNDVLAATGCQFKNFVAIVDPPHAGLHPTEGPKCSFVHWVDPEWSVHLKMILGKLSDMYEDETKERLRQNVLNAEENPRVLKEKENMEKDLSFFKVDFAKMVAEKDEAMSVTARD